MECTGCNYRRYELESGQSFCRHEECPEEYRTETLWGRKQSPPWCPLSPARDESAPAPAPPLSQEDYIRSSCVCPWCKTENVKPSGVNIDFLGDRIAQEVSCCECPRSWVNLFALTGYEEA